MNKNKLIKNNPDVPSDIFDIEASQELADIWYESELSNPDYGKINPCQDCGVEVDNLDNEICDKCWNEWKAKFKKMTGQDADDIQI